MPPSLATYQAAASSIYEPQKQADISTAQANTASDIANEEALKPQVQTDYQTAVDNLTKSTNQNVAKINQLYTLRLGGNFSGLQGNDLGGMFAGAAKAQGVIETTRANKLNQIAVTETNLKNKLTSDITALGSKYQGLEANYANTNYDSAVKAYQTEQYHQQQLDLSYARLQQSAANSAANRASRASAASNKPLTQEQTASSIMQGLTAPGIRGKDGYVSPQDYATAFKDWTQAGFNGSTFNNYFGQLKNPKNGYYNYAIRQAG